MYQKTVRVTYPLAGGRIVLRIGPTWDVQLEPEAVSDDGHQFEFTISSQRPFLYCKPCVVGTTSVRQARGAANLVVMTETALRDIYPHFYTGNCGDISAVINIDSAILGRTHLFRVY